MNDVKLRSGLLILALLWLPTLAMAQTNDLRAHLSPFGEAKLRYLRSYALPQRPPLAKESHLFAERAKSDKFIPAPSVDTKATTDKKVPTKESPPPAPGDAPAGNNSGN